MAINYFAQHRQKWIAETLRVFGYINRQHLIRKFDISSSSAAKDFRTFNRANPSAMKYNTKAKTYIATKPPAPCAETGE